VATAAEVALDRSGAVRVVRLVTAFECGAIVNPDHLLNQVEGSLVMGLGGALFEAVRFENGRITSDRFSRYRVPRFSDAPALDVVLLDRKDLPSAGAGETPIVAVAPAIGNAIFDATGVRLRGLPLVPQGMPPATS
jgi:isoquinoline 1-oxidoreductase